MRERYNDCLALPGMRFSFCIHIKDRLRQLRQVLIRNLASHRRYAAFVEFVLVDLGSTDGLLDWVKRHCAEDMRTGFLRVFRVDSSGAYHASVAKNTAHYLASGDYQRTLDADNFVDPAEAVRSIATFRASDDKVVIHGWSGRLYDGTFGSITMCRAHFHALGGYDEELLPMGYQDKDLIVRAVALHGLRVHRPDRLRFRVNRLLAKRGGRWTGLLSKLVNRRRALRNSKIESTLHTEGDLSWREMDRRNRRRSRANIQRRKYVANSGVYGIRSGIQRVR